VVGQTPLVWNGRLRLAEIWQRHRDGHPREAREFYMRIGDEETDEILATCLHGFGCGSAFVWENTFYVFAPKRFEDHGHHEYMSCSKDLIRWTEPLPLFEREPGETTDNQSVCFDGERFVMAYEAVNPKTEAGSQRKFAVPPDLVDWRKVPDVLIGADRYAARPALRCVGGYHCFTGGCQHRGGLLQYAEFDGSMPEFFERYFQ